MREVLSFVFVSSMASEAPLARSSKARNCNYVRYLSAPICMPTKNAQVDQYSFYKI